MKLGDIKKINDIYEEIEVQGTEVCIFVIDSKRVYEIEATIIEGPCKGEKWFFLREELS